ncbi:hypothetical protein [Nocardiopsis lambiniae]|uniref:Lipoprotein n=1 Tax=Nocardiopsis lambiniae TaxID=3075539 RepID=A0ABU2MFS9_9ACTN|nr:hypothetical protein [Nocardiopsis sp. DSM 44743]MDT0331453.1 hypothetical protein [Nocardiopsis sp. DSM 44743]
MKRLKQVACLALAVFAMTACNPDTDQETAMEETMTEDEAAAKVDQHITNAASALPETVELEPLGPVTFASCDDPTDGGPRGRVTVGQDQWLRGLPMEENEQNAELLYEYWTTNGYRVIRDERPDKLSIAVENEEDGFLMSLRVSIQGSLSIGASSPCVWPEGIPEA